MKFNSFIRASHINQWTGFYMIGTFVMKELIHEVGDQKRDSAAGVFL